jgi:hypothetical protein
MYHRDYPSDWDKPKFFFGEKVSLKCLSDSRLWWGLIRGMHYSYVCKSWTYEILVSPSSYLLDAPDIPEILIVWHEFNMVSCES